MSYSDEIVLSKLSALNESQDSIVSIANWVMFHRRNARRTVEIWLQRVRESSSQRRLNLIYLANEVVQQARIRKKEEFVQAFTPVIAEATELALSNNPPVDIQQKVKRVIQVWRQRMAFDPETLNLIDARVEAVEREHKSTGGTGRKIGGGILGGGATAVPEDLKPTVTSHQALSGKLSASAISVGSANMEYNKQMESNNLPAPPVYAARLSQLLKTLDTAHTAVQDAISAREELIRNLELLLNTNKAALENEQRHLQELSMKHTRATEAKDEVEKKIMSGFDSSNGDGCRDGHSTEPTKSPEEIERPEVEALTPPPVDSYEEDEDAEAPQHEYPQYGGPDLFSTLSALNGSQIGKRELIDEMGGMDELDSDVAEMLRNEAQAQAGQQQNQHQNKRMRFDPALPAADDKDDEYHP